MSRFLFVTALSAWACLVAAGCARMAEAPGADLAPSQEPAREVRTLERRMQQYEAELRGSLEASATPNCRRARALSGTICRLAERICRIADRHPGDPSLAGRCEDGRRRCEKARVKVAVRCTMPP